MSPRTFVITVGVLLLAIGLFVGLRPHSVGDASCGSAFSADRQAPQNVDFTTDLTNSMSGLGRTTTTTVQDECKDATGSSGIAWALIVGGALTVVGGVVVQRGETQAELEHRARVNGGS